mgnify:CR=1 FL=1
MFTAKDYHDLTLNSRRAIAKLADFTCPADCKHCPFYCEEVIIVSYGTGVIFRSHEGHCIVNSARVEIPDWRYD